MKLKLTTIITILIVTAISGNAQDDILKQIFELAGQSKNWVEGFQKNLGNNEFTYHSFRNDVSKSLLTRANNGQMAIEWETAIIPENMDASEIGFLWMAAIDITSEPYIFDLFLNGEKRFEIPTTTKKTWNIETKDGCKLSFTGVETDQHGDAHGYMSMIVPKKWIQNGSTQKIKLVGRASNSNSWLIVYQASDALAYLQNAVEQDVWMEIDFEKTINKLKGTIKAPISLSGKTITYTSEKRKRTVQLTEYKGFAKGAINLPSSALHKPFYLNDLKGEVFIVKSLGENSKSSKLLAKAVLHNESSSSGNKIHLSAKRNYKPKTVSSLLALAESNLSKGEIYLMNSSHQDIAWMDSPENCIIERDTMLFSPLFELAQKDKNYRFDIEDALMIKEFTERHPDKKELVKEMLKDGRISCGSTYIQPYEEMYSGESLARQFYFGAKWLKDEFDYDATVYWNVDVPGRTLQMMQLMHKAGTKYLMMSRHERGLYKWYSPDGSFVTAFSPGHYANAFTPLQKNFHEAAQFLATSSLDWEKYYSSEINAPVVPLLSDWDMSPAIDYSHLIQQWHQVDELQKEDGTYVPVKLPGIKISSAPEFFDALNIKKPKLQNIAGERPSVWLYIHGPSHQKAIKASREGDILLTQAEKFATIDALMEGSFKNYPNAKLRNAWEAKIYPDHGWGGKHGDITDAYFHSKYEFAKEEAKQIADESLKNLATKIKTDSKKGKPLVVFNSLNWKRNDPVSVGLAFTEEDFFNLSLKDESETEINYQLTDIEKYNNGSLKKARLHFIAENIPSLGYKTFYVKSIKGKTSNTSKEFAKETENQFYKLVFTNGGIASIYDKELKKELISADKFAAGEVFTMHSEGNGAGEFSDIQQPDMEGFDKTGNYKTEWETEETGAVFTTFKCTTKLNDALVEQKIKLYHQQKQIDFETALLNWEGTLYREFRIAFPLNMMDGTVAYEVPFGVVEVGKDELAGAAGERYNTLCKDIHPRGIENWISSGNSEFGVTMSSSVAVADWIDPTETPVKNQVLQAILLASRRSCHGEGNEYLQAGDHYFKFSITSHKPGWENGANFGRQANDRLLSVWAESPVFNATLPETQSFFQTDKPLVFLSTLKKAEDSDDIVVRIVDMEGKDKTLTLQTFFNITNAWRTNLIEQDIGTIKFDLKTAEICLGHHAIETLKIR